MHARTGSTTRLLACALLMVMAASCKDSLTPTSTTGVNARLNGSAGTSDLDVAFQEAVCGVIPATLVIRENTRLTCDVVCTNATGPCIQFGRDNITLWLNGFTMTGPATPPTGCAASPAFGPGNPGPFPFDGVSTAGFDHVKVRGPGMVQNFRRHGIFVFETEKARVEQVTSHYNCFSGILLGLSNDNDIKENVSVRNGSASGAAPCGGNCITNSNGNRVYRNHYLGNGSIVVGGPTNTPNDFGVGLVGSSSDNLIEDNSIGGNINGVLLFPATTGNVIRRNIIAGNPPVQLSVGAGTPVGVDIRDASPANANTFHDNLCVTYEGATMPPPCPSFPRFSSHR
jgi:parallel beta-helix repeat protein